jgi:hypothetical protein
MARVNDTLIKITNTSIQLKTMRPIVFKACLKKIASYCQKNNINLSKEKEKVEFLKDLKKYLNSRKFNVNMMRIQRRIF